MDIDIAALDAFLEGKRRALLLPGLTVAVVQDGRIAYLRGLGTAGLSQAITAQTPLVIGSLSKSFTALAVMQLVEVGKVALDEPIQCYIPWFRLADPISSAQITLRHLLTHTSGISRFVGRELLGGSGRKTIEQSVRELASVKLTKLVGAEFQYSNTNYLIAGLVVQIVSGISYEDYIQQHIIRPLGMQHTYTSEQEAVHNGLAVGYRWWFGVPLPYRAPYLPDALPAAFITANAEDLARYALALLNGGTLDGTSVLSTAGVAALFRPQVTTASPDSSYALGWRIEKLDGVPIIRHGGEVSNFLAEAVLLSEQRVGVVVLMNANNGVLPLVTPQVSRLGSDTARFLLGMSQPRRRLSLLGFYTLLDAVLVALSAYQMWSLAAVLSSGPARRGHSALGLASLCEVVLSVAALRAIPRLADSPWRLLRLYVPDITSWLFAVFGCSLVKCFVLLCRLLHSS